MKKQFSTSWKGSKQGRKQRKYSAQAPLHIKAKMLSAHLSIDLRKKYNRRAVPIRKGDTVKVMIGNFKKKTGKVADVQRLTQRVSVEGLQVSKKDGSKVNVYFYPSNLMIIELNVEDKKRLDSIKKENKTEVKTKETK
ncbi:MAG: 50S ribosomal protein L24 [archaeon]|nr:50S ribosomal protein L24 [archaeon]